MAGFDENQRKLIPPKSKPSISNSVVWFINNTARDVDIYWLDYDGVPTLYKTLVPTTFFMVRTFVGHPWIAVDTKTHDRLLLKSEFVYYPRIIDRPLEPGCETFRWSAKITVPLFTLRNRSAQVIVDNVYTTDVSSVDKLQLPNTLRNEVIQIMSNRSRDFIELYKEDCSIGLPENMCHQ